jgi:hypothetical protein
MASSFLLDSNRRITGVVGIAAGLKSENAGLPCNFSLTRIHSLSLKNLLHDFCPKFSREPSAAPADDPNGTKTRPYPWETKAFLVRLVAARAGAESLAGC